LEKTSRKDLAGLSHFSFQRLTPLFLSQGGSAKASPHLPPKRHCRLWNKGNLGWMARFYPRKWAMITARSIRDKNPPAFGLFPPFFPKENYWKSAFNRFGLFFFKCSP
jgi:hypothetical protein